MVFRGPLPLSAMRDTEMGPRWNPPDPTVVSDGIGINISSGHVDVISELRFVLAEQDS